MFTVEGIVKVIIFFNKSTGYTVCKVKSDKNNIMVVGNMPFIKVFENIKMTGTWISHPEYGGQFKVDYYEKLLPNTLEEIEEYLLSGMVYGIGASTAKRIVKKFGDKSLDIIRFYPEELAKVKGIPIEKANKISILFEQDKITQNIAMFLQQYGIKASFANEVFRMLGENAIDKIKKNPYILVEGNFGIDFNDIDRIAMNFGIEPTPEERIISGIKYVLLEALSNGHTYLPEEKLKYQNAKLLKVKIQDIENALINLTLKGNLCFEKKGDTKNFYLTSYYEAEVSVCNKLAELSTVKFNSDLRGFEKKIKKIQKDEGIDLATMQIQAVKEALISGVFVITGGPGTGKTTIIKTIINIILSEKYTVVLAAPTGRAAKRMSEATGYEAKTIHRLLEIGYAKNSDQLVFGRTESNPIDADLIIIDEMSMVDIQLMSGLLKAIDYGTRVILVGDIDQLSSVGAGNVLKDIIESGKIKTIKLTEIFRQAQESMITMNAHTINNGIAPILNKKDSDFYFIPEDSGENIVKVVAELCAKRLPSAYGYDPIKDIQVLTPTRKGLAGVGKLNTEIQKLLNPYSINKNEKNHFDNVLREGDKVMQIKNNYNLKWIKNDNSGNEGTGVFNGDMGTINFIDRLSQKVYVQFEDEKEVEYDSRTLEEIEIAYAVTIHKPQGSEFPVVVLPLCSGPSILMTRRLLYTAITRAKKLVVLVGDKDILYQMVRNEREILRYSDLSDKLKEVFLKNGLST